MLDIKERMEVIKSLLSEGTDASLTYAALECRLTLEYLCYEKFKINHAYLSASDLKGKWQPKHIVKIVSDEVDEFVSKEIKVEISASIPDVEKPTAKDYEALDYVTSGTQKNIRINKIASLWNGVANVALHLPVPSLTSGELSIYGDSVAIRRQVEKILDYFSTLEGGILISGHAGEVYKFGCGSCGTPVQRPVKSLREVTVVSCINPQCRESYTVKLDRDEGYIVSRRVYSYSCGNCGNTLEVPINYFSEMRLNQQLDIKCGDCGNMNSVFMRPVLKPVSE